MAAGAKSAPSRHKASEMGEVSRLEANVNREPARHYTNHVNVYASPFDVVIEAGIKGPPGDAIESRCALIMSPQMAKVLSQLLAATIQQWEAKHGEIPLSGAVARGGGPKPQPS